MPSNRQSSALPVLSLLLGATLWGLLWYPLRLLEDNGLPGLWSSLAMFTAAAAVTLPLIWTRRAELARQPALLLLLAVATGWCNVAFVLAIIEGEVVRVLLLFYLSPVWATLLAYLFLGERLGGFAWATLALAIAGALVMLWEPSLGSPLPQDRADWLAIGSGFAFAVSNTVVRKLQHTSLPVKAIMAWWGGVALAGLWIMTSSIPPPEAHAGTITAAALLGVFGIVVMTLVVQYGVTHMPVHRSAVILLFELVVGAFSAYLLASEAVQVKEWVGGLLIVAAAYLSAKASRK